MKTKYEYLVVNKQYPQYQDVCNTRQEARNLKNSLKEDFDEDCKIVQLKYVLEEQREIR